LIDLLFVIR